MKQKDLLLSHMDDLATKAVKIGCTASRFLTPVEVHNVTAYFIRRHEIKLTFDGGYEGAERVRAIFLNPEWGCCDRTDMFTVLKIQASTNEKPGHRDILGAVMALGIKRDTIGDIIESLPALICLPELSGYIAESLIKAGRIRVSLSEIALSELPVGTENLSVKTRTVASPRLDAVIGAAFGLPRSKAAELVEGGRVNLNHELCLRPSKEVREGVVLSVRGFGRAKLLEIGGMSKKGRIFIKTGLY